MFDIKIPFLEHLSDFFIFELLEVEVVGLVVAVHENLGSYGN